MVLVFLIKIHLKLIIYTVVIPLTLNETSKIHFFTLQNRDFLDIWPLGLNQSAKRSMIIILMTNVYVSIYKVYSYDLKLNNHNFFLISYKDNLRTLLFLFNKILSYKSLTPLNSINISNSHYFNSESMER